jgi:hypothetical protein
MTHEEWVERAVNAAVEQVGQEAIEDPAALDFIADALLCAENVALTND